MCPWSLGLVFVDWAEDDLADLSRDGVEHKEEEDGDERQQQQHHQDAPVPAPDEEDESLEGVHKPVEGGFGAAVGEGSHSDQEAPASGPTSQSAGTYLGFSRGSGSFRPFPTGRFSASSTVSSSNSASTFP